jgi:hypothetical protein
MPSKIFLEEASGLTIILIFYFMGTYMQTGLIHDFRVSRSHELGNPGSDAFESEVAKAMVDNPEEYSCSEEGGMYYWRLRQEAKEANLLALVKRYFEDFYGSETSYFDKNCKPVISFLSTNPSGKELSKRALESEELAEVDGWSRRLNIHGQEVKVYFSVWVLSNEGKVMFEELDRHLTFFEKTIRRTYADNPLGGSLVIEIGQAQQICASSP